MIVLHALRKTKRTHTFLEYRLPTAEDEIDVALDVATLVVVSTLVVEQGIVWAVEGAMVECYLISGHHGCD